MAKFKKGDRVKVKIDGKTYVGKVGDTYGSSGYFVDFDKNLVTPGKWGFKSGKDMMFSESQLTLANAVTSKNPVGANALMARNAVFDVNGKQLNKGDKVKIAAGNLPDAKKGESGVVTWVWTDGSNGVDVRLASGKTCSYKGTAFAKNAVAANAGVQFGQHDIYANLNIAQNRIVNAINLGSHLEDPFKSKLAPGIAKLKQINTDLGRAISDLAMAYKAADKESEG